MKDCYKRTYFADLKRLQQGPGGMKERAIEANMMPENDTHQYVVFFDNDDCNLDGVIDNAWLDGGCSSSLANNPAKINDGAGWKGWSVWDKCEGETECTME